MILWTSFGERPWCLLLSDTILLDVVSGEHIKFDPESKTDQLVPGRAPDPLPGGHTGEYRLNLFGTRQVVTGPREGSPFDGCDQFCSHGQVCLISHWTCCQAHDFFSDCRGPSEGKLSQVKAFAGCCFFCNRAASASFTVLLNVEEDASVEVCGACYLRQLQQEEGKEEVWHGAKLTQLDERWTCHVCDEPQSCLQPAYWNDEEKEATCLACAAGHSGVFHGVGFKERDEAHIRAGQFGVATTWAWCLRFEGCDGTAPCTHKTQIVCEPHFSCCSSRDPQSRRCMRDMDPDVVLSVELLDDFLSSLDPSLSSDLGKFVTVTSCASAIGELRKIRAMLAQRSVCVKAGFPDQTWLAEFTSSMVCVAALALLMAWLVSAMHPNNFVLEDAQGGLVQKCRHIASRAPSLLLCLDLRLKQIEAEQPWVRL